MSGCSLDYGWRIAFLASIVLVGIGLYVRIKIEETPVFRAAQRRASAMHIPLREALTEAPRQILLVAGAATVMSALFYTGTTFLSSYGTSPAGEALPRTVLLSVLIIAAVAKTLGIIVSAISSDRFGRRRLIMLSRGGAAAWPLLLFPLLGTKIPFAFGIGVIGTLGLEGLAFGPIGAFLAETFPTRYRYTGAGASFNLAQIVGGAIPPLLSAPLVSAFGSFAIGVLLCALSLLSLVCTGILPETKDCDMYQGQPSDRSVGEPIIPA